MNDAAWKKASREALNEQIGRLQRMLEATKTLSSTLDLAKLTEIIPHHSSRSACGSGNRFHG